MKVENWCGHKIRFVEHNGEWWAVLKDICDALELRTDKVAERLDSDMLTRLKIETSNHPTKGNRSKGENRTRWMIVVNELGIYEALFASRRLEARKFRRWSTTVLRRLRQHVGLEGYQVMSMTDETIQAEIDSFLDTIFYDEETKQVMRSVIVQGGDVEQVPLFSGEFDI